MSKENVHVCLHYKVEHIERQLGHYARAALGDRGSRHPDAPQCRSASKVRQKRREERRPSYSSARSRILFTMMSKPLCSTPSLSVQLFGASFPVMRTSCPFFRRSQGMICSLSSNSFLKMTQLRKMVFLSAPTKFFARLKRANVLFSLGVTSAVSLPEIWM